MVRTFLSVVVLAALLGLLARPAAAAESPPCGLTRFVSLDVPADPSGMVRLPVTIQGIAKRMLLDSGSAASMLSAGLAAQLKLVHHPLRYDAYFDATGRPLNDAARADLFQVGPVKVESPTFLLMPGRAADDPDAGLLGVDFMHYFYVEIDPAHHVVNLYSQDHCPGRVVYWTKDYADLAMTKREDSRVSLRMVLDDKPIDAVLDTGSGSSWMTLDVAARLFGITPDSPGVTPNGDVSGIAGHSLPSYAYRFTALSFDGLTVRQPLIILIPNKYLQDHPDDWRAMSGDHEIKEHASFSIGMGILGRLHSYFAFGEGKFYASAASAK